MYERYVESDVKHAPTPLITKYVAALLDRWPELSEDEDDTSPWSAGPLIRAARGPLIYFPMRYSMADEASAFAAQLATSMGLVCFDPQINGLRTE
ncbi:hypothetical protein LFM09_13560 [Lentzea alba]|uniref:hypothetical protein n=1 Tax=Lentzea alba TaxID=2714351 RepID=UPI0039BF9F3E